MQHPLFYAVAKIATRRKLRTSGRSFSEVNEMMAACDPDLIDTAVATAGGQVPDFSAKVGDVGAFGDGHIIKAITDFFATPLGQIVLKILEALLMGLIAI